MKTLVVATNNAGKLVEFRAMLSVFPFDIKSMNEFRIPSPEETGMSFVENALLKARHAAARANCAALADDSGLVVDALHGKPGIHSARFSGINATDQDNNDALLAALQDVPESQRTARYICILCFLRSADDPDPLISRGVFEGTILTSARGTGGYGYDPLFYCPETQCTVAEMPLEIKNVNSHRGIALRQLRQMLVT